MRWGWQRTSACLARVDDQRLSDAYFAADVMVFPVLDLPGDVEGFGMVAVEAAAHGLPTVAFAVGGRAGCGGEWRIRLVVAFGGLCRNGSKELKSSRIARTRCLGVGLPQPCSRFCVGYFW